MAIEPLVEAHSSVQGDVPVATDPAAKDHQIRERAYLIWVDEGQPHGRDLDHWLRAKWQIEGAPDP